ncbi:MAG: hypothetical protein COB02_13630 [Candidatus Cloacimonadota bacterium]|nr:MAG: hypothetical protein COB02_13630 [Candidatus Cloacimonadota bacterium]
MSYKYIFLMFLSTSLCFANPWASGEDHGYYALTYSVAEYDRIYLTDKQFHLAPISPNKVAREVSNESLQFDTEIGINTSDSIIVKTQFSNIGGYDSVFPQNVFGPSYSGIGDSYIGFKRNYRNRKIGMSMELGYIIADNYKADAITSPGFGSDAIALTWHWGLILTPKDYLSTSIQYRYLFDDAISDQFSINFDYTKVLNNSWSLRFFGSFINSMGGVNLFDPASGWTNFSFHRKDEMRLQFGIGTSYNINDIWSMSVNVAHLFDARNTDGSDSSLSVSLVRRF